MQAIRPIILVVEGQLSWTLAEIDSILLAKQAV